MFKGFGFGILFVLAVSFCTISTASFGDEFVSLAVPNFLTPDAQACGPAIEAANTKCYTEAKVEEAKGIAHGQAELAKNPSGTLDGSAAGARFGQTATGVNTIGAVLCQQANDTCQRYCGEQVIGKMEAELQQCNTNQQYQQIHAQICANLPQDIRIMRNTNKACQVSYLGTGSKYAYSAGASADAVRQYTNVNLASKGETAAEKAGNFLKDNAGKIALGAGAVGLGYMMLKGGKDGGGGSGASGTGGAKGALDCTKPDAAANALCHGQLIEECGNPANVGNDKCSNFTNTYCGFSANPEMGQVNNAPGLGSALCKDAMAAKFCKAEAKASCYSCLNLKDRQSAACQQNPRGCQHDNTAQEMGYFKHQCPDDPVFTDPRWQSVVAVAPPSTTQQPGTALTDGTPSQGAVGQPPANTTGTRVPSGGTVGLASFPDASPKLGPSVFSRSSQTVQALCEKGNLNNCGLRRSLK